VLVLALGCAAAVTVSVRSRWSGPGETPPATSAEIAPPRTRIELPAIAPSPVESLRAKTGAGQDRFTVEAADESLEPRLDVLKRAFLDPESDAGRAAADDVLRPDFVARPFSPSGEKTILERDGIAVKEGSFAGGGAASAERGPDALRRRLAEWIAPLTRLESAAFKLIEIQGDPASGALTSTIVYELCGSDGGSERRQWTGTASLSWSRDHDAWKLERWETRDGTRAELRGKPFTDVTELALGGNASYQDLLVPSIDDFRDRLDAASGIDVYGHNGIAVGDANGDGMDDLYVAMPPGLPNLLLLWQVSGAFIDASRESGADALDGTYQALFIDDDNDGDEDLFLVTEAGIVILANDGRGHFEEAPTGLPELAASRAISAAAADYDLDGLVDVYVCSYVFWRGAVGEVGSRLPFPYHEAHNGAPNFLLRNRGGKFENVTAAAGLDIENNRFSFAASWGDYDSDGDPDLYVANDFGSNNLYRNNGNGTFTEVTREAGVEDVGAGMSVAWEDYDNDGRLDLYVGNMLSSAGRRVTGTPDYKRESPELQRLYRRHARGNSLFRNRGDGTFEDVSESTRAYFGRWSWSSGFVDFNLDGREDIYVQNGFISNSRKDDL
jgi:hypothetical protein